MALKISLYGNPTVVCGHRVRWSDLLCEHADIIALIYKTVN
jgi:hypothetical protein